MRAVFIALLLGASAFPPLASDASVLSIFSGFFGKKAEKETLNSQTVSLLKASLSSENAPRGGGDITIVDDSALQPDAGPLGASYDVVDEGSDRISVYVVRKGDSISGIARMFGVSPNTIVWANDLKNGIIAEGQKLVILPVSGIMHTVKKGDTVKKVAERYKADLGEVLVFNGLSPDAELAEGSTILIPDGEGVPVNLATGRAVTVRGASAPSYVGYYIRPLVGGYKTQGLHGYNGIDIAGPLGTPILAAAAGEVLIARQGGWNGGYGTYVVLLHRNGTQTLYSHLQRVNVEPGVVVAQGETIGFMGNTGRSTGVHLHFEIRGARNPF
ncbi:MAG: peptidoglycan DD-metalloendopeptidase family protein [bacterium]|nr:peptidoglycan DD-metalloendopeptidase family protein [bacterium]